MLSHNDKLITTSRRGDEKLKILLPLTRFIKLQHLLSMCTFGRVHGSLKFTTYIQFLVLLINTRGLVRRRGRFSHNKNIEE